MIPRVVTSLYFPTSKKPQQTFLLDETMVACRGFVNLRDLDVFNSEGWRKIA